jgi:hypothetical protein
LKRGGRAGGVVDRLKAGGGGDFGGIGNVPTQVFFELSTWGKIEGASLDLLEKPPVVAEHLVI